jgi:hypothetical protein
MPFAFKSIKDKIEAMNGLFYEMKYLFYGMKDNY